MLTDFMASQIQTFSTNLDLLRTRGKPLLLLVYSLVETEARNGNTPESYMKAKIGTEDASETLVGPDRPYASFTTPLDVYDIFPLIFDVFSSQELMLISTSSGGSGLTAWEAGLSSSSCPERFWARSSLSSGN